LGVYEGLNVKLNEAPVGVERCSLRQKCSSTRGTT